MTRELSKAECEAVTRLANRHPDLVALEAALDRGPRPAAAAPALTR